MPSFLETLIDPLEAGEFANLFWDKTPFSCHSASRNIETVYSQINAISIESLFQHHDGKIRLHKINSLGQYLSVECKTLAEAQTSFANGTSVAFLNVESWLGLAQTIRDNLANILQISPTCFECVAFATPVGSGVPFHFDGTEVLILQLYGKKTWKIAPNAVEFPTVPFAPSCVTPIIPELELYATPESLMVPLDKITTIELKTGSLLFLPRGYWHETKSLELSISLSFVSQIPSLLDLLMNAIRKHFVKIPNWRCPIRPNGICYVDIEKDLKDFAADALVSVVNSELSRLGFENKKNSTHGWLNEIRSSDESRSENIKLYFNTDRKSVMKVKLCG